MLRHTTKSGSGVRGCQQSRQGSTACRPASHQNPLQNPLQSDAGCSPRNTVPQFASTRHVAAAASSAFVVTTPIVPQQNASTAVNGAAGTRPLNVVIAGAGIGGLVLAVALLKKGINVKIFERDLTAIRGEGKYRGPIQVQSNALAALEAIDAEMADEIMAAGCITGDRINGLVDGVTGKWYVKFDTFHPAVNKGLPVTRVVSRVKLQEILAAYVEKYGGPGTIQGGCNVTSFQELTDTKTGLSQVSIQLEDGSTHSGDVLVGADGIWSKVRKQLIGDSKANYSGYTCYTGISDFTPADINVVGYRVFLGNRQYFVSSDVGDGRMQWYGFHKEEAGGTDVDGERKKRLLEIFGNWDDNVVDLIKATPEEDVLRRDIFDRPPIFKWAEGRVALLGDSAHAMQPNLGQGGCMAIEDAFLLANDLAKSMEKVQHDVAKLDVPKVLKNYQDQRLMRASMIHGMAGMAAFMASTYQTYLGDMLPWQWLRDLKIPHPGRVAGRLVMLLTMPTVLDWVLGGNVQKTADSRVSQCRISDKPKGFDSVDFDVFVADDDAIVKAADADWMLISERPVSASAHVSAAEAASSSEAKGVYLGEEPAIIGRAGGGGNLSVECEFASDKHAKVWKRGSDYVLQDLGSTNGTWLNGQRMLANAVTVLAPGDKIEFGSHPSKEIFKVKLQHVILRGDDLDGHKYGLLAFGKKRQVQLAEAEAAHDMEDQQKASEAMAVV